MASSVSPTGPLFEEHQVSSSVSADESPRFFKEHGIFYQASDTIGRLVEEVQPGVDGLKHFKATLLQDLRAKRILEPFLEKPPKLYYALASDPGHYFASTTEDNQDHRPVVYMWRAGTELEFFDKSHTESKGVRAANGMMETPYRFLRNKYGLENKVRMEKGG
ncbi:hypothetical protein AK830_g6704 [Neonectria ditissima]|uniref:TauD/TfdA-like domain-containing protein n=1 Tax=Neonectria ditissima TaxID=78410 RepID=A0A0P7BHE1_9HYPO|nr:hypothetical protein AK830_g6704 [Neonectria ditissima]